MRRRLTNRFMYLRTLNGRSTAVKKRARRSLSEGLSTPLLLIGLEQTRLASSTLSQARSSKRPMDLALQEGHMHYPASEGILEPREGQSSLMNNRCSSARVSRAIGSVAKTPLAMS